MNCNQFYIYPKKKKVSRFCEVDVGVSTILSLELIAIRPRIMIPTCTWLRDSISFDLLCEEPYMWTQ